MLLWLSHWLNGNAPFKLMLESEQQDLADGFSIMLFFANQTARR